jgi:hypothetical protein
MTVGDLKEMLKHSEDDEPLILKLVTHTTLFGEHNENLKCTGASSSAGGRVTLLWFEPEKSNGNS